VLTKNRRGVRRKGDRGQRQTKLSIRGMGGVIKDDVIGKKKNFGKEGTGDMLSQKKTSTSISIEEAARRRKGDLEGGLSESKSKGVLSSGVEKERPI